MTREDVDNLHESIRPRARGNTLTPSQPLRRAGGQRRAPAAAGPRGCNCA
jgi:hypothetical protein